MLESCRTNARIRRKKNPKDQKGTVRDLRRKVNPLSKVVSDRKIVTELTSMSVPPEKIKQSL